MTTVMRTVLPLLFDHRTQALVAVLAALAAGLVLGPDEAAAWAKGGG
jgi:hypothetical protein